MVKNWSFMEYPWLETMEFLWNYCCRAFAILSLWFFHANFMNVHGVLMLSPCFSHGHSFLMPVSVSRNTGVSRQICSCGITHFLQCRFFREWKPQRCWIFYSTKSISNIMYAVDLTQKFRLQGLTCPQAAGMPRPDLQSIFRIFQRRTRYISHRFRQPRSDRQRVR